MVRNLFQNIRILNKVKTARFAIFLDFFRYDWQLVASFQEVLVEGP